MDGVMKNQYMKDYMIEKALRESRFEQMRDRQ
jgi:hypothetical protein